MKLHPSRRALLALGLALLAPLAGCSDDTASARATTSGIATTFYPLTDFAQRMIGPEVEVRCPLPIGEDPIFWQPDTEAMAVFRSARLVVSNGAEFEKWLASASLPESRHVRTADGFADRFIQFETGVKHSHGAAGEHEHVGVDGHTWVDPMLAIEQVRALERGIVGAYPEHAGVVHDRALLLIRELEFLHAGWSDLTPRLAKVELLASHPAYRYLAARHGLAIESFDLDPEELLSGPDATRARTLVDGSDRPVLMFWEGQPRADLVDALESELGIRSVVVSPAENPDVPPEGGFVGLQRANLARVAAALDALGV